MAKDQTEADEAARPRRRASRPRARSADAGDRAQRGEPGRGGQIDWDAYRPGDVLGYVLHGTAGFEDQPCPASFAALAAREQTVAAAGMIGPAQPLPHRAAIQAAFGAHDVSGIQAYVGGPAADAAHELDAVAYASAGSVAFAGPPDLHTAAHEAAHVVQQTGGVARKAIDDGNGDAHEAHADRVADLVVAGQSAEAELSMVGTAS